MPGKAKSFLILGGIFLAGAVSGVLLDNKIGGREYGWIVGRPEPKRSGPRPDFATRQVESLNKEIGLTAEQKIEVEKLARQTDEELRALRKESMAASGERIKAMHARIQLILSVPQQAKFAEFQKKQEDRMRTVQNGPEGRPPPPPDGSARPTPEGRPATP